MKKIFYFLASLGLLFSLCPAAQLPPADAKTASDYFLKLRTAYAATPDFTGNWVIDPERDALMKLYDENNPRDFIAKSSAWLKKCPVDAKVHLMLAILQGKTGDYDGAIYHRLMFYGLASSIMATGDGKTASHAYKVIAVDEEYTILNYLGATLERQSLVGSNDVMDVTLDGKPAQIYFDATIPLAMEKKLLEPVKTK